MEAAIATPLMAVNVMDDRNSLPAGVRTGAGAVTRLTLTDFRCYGAARIDCPVEEAALPVVLTGPNGAGKTNLLEAISLLSPGRGLRRAGLKDFAREDGPGGWAVAAGVSGPLGEASIGTGRDAGAQDGERRQVRIDGEPQSGQAVLAEWLSLQWLTPQMDRLFLEGPSARRRFLDRLVFGFDAGHAGRVQAYETAMRDRAKLLRDEARPDATWLSALEAGMAERAIAIAAGAHHTCATLVGGGIKCWGWGLYGRLGYDNTDSKGDAP
ncbi:MAG: AAA family ATPase, partial [Rhodospirillales bacterium]